MLSLESQCSLEAANVSAFFKHQAAVGDYQLSDRATYGASQSILAMRGTRVSDAFAGSAVGSCTIGGSALNAKGMSYSAVSSGTAVVLCVSAYAGAASKGTAAANTLSGTEHSDIFWGGAGNDVISGVDGRDCAVYGTENWGQDTIVADKGSFAVLFNGLSASDVTSSLSGTKMTFTKKSDASQKITVSGWYLAIGNNAKVAVGSAVYGGTLSAFNAWMSAAAPTTAQTSAMRQEVWQKIGLAQN